MARNKTDVGAKFNAPFPTRLRALMDEKEETQESVAQVADKTRQTISQYVNGISEPSYDTLVKIADYFDVSTDYLLGRTEDPNRAPCAVDELGLSAKAIHAIRSCRYISFYEDAMEGLNLLITQGSFLFFASRIKQFCDAVSMDIDLAHSYELLAKVGDDPKFKKLADEAVATEAFRDAFLSNYPQYKNYLDIRVGTRYITAIRRDLEDEFREMLREISNYDKFIASQYKGSV